MKRRTARKHKHHIKGGDCGCNNNTPNTLFSKGGGSGDGYINPASFSNSSSIPHYPYNDQNNNPLDPARLTPARLVGGKKNSRSSSRRRKRSSHRSFKKRKSKGVGGGYYNTFMNYFTSTAGSNNNILIQNTDTHNSGTIPYK
jgi:hypothetical protein